MVARGLVVLRGDAVPLHGRLSLMLFPWTVCERVCGLFDNKQVLSYCMVCFVAVHVQLAGLLSGGGVFLARNLVKCLDCGASAACPCIAVQYFSSNLPLPFRTAGVKVAFNRRCTDFEPAVCCVVQRAQVAAVFALCCVAGCFRRAWLHCLCICSASSLQARAPSVCAFSPHLDRVYCKSTSSCRTLGDELGHLPQQVVAVSVCTHGQLSTSAVAAELQALPSESNTQAMGDACFSSTPIVCACWCATAWSELSRVLGAIPIGVALRAGLAQSFDYMLGC